MRVLAGVLTFLLLATQATLAPAQNGAGFEAHVDPKTGALIDPPPAASPALGRSASPATGAPAATQQVPAPGGGTMVELRGRFMSQTTATVDATGHVGVGCTQTTHP